MLKGIDEIDWGRLEHAYGPATDVPGMLRQLTSPDPGERGEAVQALFGTIWHQGTVYEASAHAVPFLIELLESASVADKDQILVLLAHLAKGTSYHDVHQHLPLFRNQALTTDWKERIQRELAWVRSTTAAVNAGKPVYIGLISHPDSVVREAAAYLLASFTSPSPELARRLWSEYQRETDDRVKTSILLAFGILAEPTVSNRDLVLSVLDGARERSVELAAALSLIRLAPGEVPAEVLAVVLAAALEPARYAPFQDYLWAQIDGVERLLTNCLSHLEGTSALAAEDALVEMIEGQEHPQALATAEILLNIAFRQPIAADATFATLTDQQQRILRAIARNPNVWVQTLAGQRAASVKSSLLMRSCGLPGKLEEFLTFVTGEASTFPPGQAKAPAKSRSWSWTRIFRSDRGTHSGSQSDLR